MLIHLSSPSRSSTGTGILHVFILQNQRHLVLFLSENISHCQKQKNTKFVYAIEHDISNQYSILPTTDVSEVRLINIQTLKIKLCRMLFKSKTAKIRISRGRI